MKSEPPQLKYPEGVSKEEKQKLLARWFLDMSVWRVEQAKAAGAEWMEWLSCQDGNECEFCRSLDGCVFRIEEFDVVKLMHQCTSPNGCRCVCGPADGPEQAD